MHIIDICTYISCLYICYNEELVCLVTKRFYILRFYHCKPSPNVQNLIFSCDYWKLKAVVRNIRSHGFTMMFFMCIYICKLYKIARAFNEQIKDHATLGITPWNCSAGSLLCVNTRVNSTTNGILFNHVCIFLY